MANTPANPSLDPPVPAANQRTLKLGWLAFLVLVLIALAAVAGLIPRWHQREALRAENRELAISTVAVVSPSLGKPHETLSLPAEVKPFTEAPIYARANGYVKRWLVDLGAKVETGQLLAEIDTPEINQDLARSQAEVAEAEAALELAKLTAARWSALVKTASVSEQEAAEKQADLALKAAMLNAARASVKRLEEQQGFGRVVAPFAGTITMRRVDVGDLVTAGGSRELFRLAQTSTLRVFVRVPQVASRQVSPGQAAELVIPELPGRIFAAKVVRTSGAMAPDSRTLLVELEVNNANADLLAGSYAQIRLTETRIESPLTLPSNTLLFRAEGTQVGVVQSDGTVQLRSITLGRDFGPTMEILEGVGPSDKVILNPADSLVSGTKVRIAEKQ
jgi:membrane fusion protein (multidrug efflux system)